MYHQSRSLVPLYAPPSGFTGWPFSGPSVTAPVVPVRSAGVEPAPVKSKMMLVTPVAYVGVEARLELPEARRREGQVAERVEGAVRVRRAQDLRGGGAVLLLELAARVAAVEVDDVAVVALLRAADLPVAAGDGLALRVAGGPVRRIARLRRLDLAVAAEGRRAATPDLQMSPAPASLPGLHAVPSLAGVPGVQTWVVLGQHVPGPMQAAVAVCCASCPSTRTRTCSLELHPSPAVPFLLRRRTPRAPSRQPSPQCRLVDVHATKAC